MFSSRPSARWTSSAANPPGAPGYTASPSIIAGTCSRPGTSATCLQRGRSRLGKRRCPDRFALARAGNQGTRPAHPKSPRRLARGIPPAAAARGRRTTELRTGRRRLTDQTADAVRGKLHRARKAFAALFEKTAASNHYEKPTQAQLARKTSRNSARSCAETNRANAAVNLRPPEELLRHDALHTPVPPAIRATVCSTSIGQCRAAPSLVAPLVRGIRRMNFQTRNRNPHPAPAIRFSTSSRAKRCACRT